MASAGVRAKTTITSSFAFRIHLSSYFFDERCWLRIAPLVVTFCFLWSNIDNLTLLKDHDSLISPQFAEEKVLDRRNHILLLLCDGDASAVVAICDQGLFVGQSSAYALGFFDSIMGDFLVNDRWATEASFDQRGIGATKIGGQPWQAGSTGAIRPTTCRPKSTPQAAAAHRFVVQQYK